MVYIRMYVYIYIYIYIEKNAVFLSLSPCSWRLQGVLLIAPRVLILPEEVFFIFSSSYILADCCFVWSAGEIVGPPKKEKKKIEIMIYIYIYRDMLFF